MFGNICDTVFCAPLIAAFYAKRELVSVVRVLSLTVVISADLAYYNKGSSFPNLIVTNINSSIDNVLLPVMSSAQDSRDAVRNMTRRAIRTSSFIMWPMMIGLAVVAKPLIIILLTDKWVAAVPFLQVACISRGLEPLQTANLSAIKSVGRSDIYFKLEIIKKTIAIGI